MTLNVSIIADFFALLIMIFFRFKGFARGFVNELSGLLGTLAGFVLLWKYSPDLAGFLKIKFGINDVIAYVIAIVAIFLAANLVVSLLGRLVRKVVYFGHLSLVDKVIGAFCGFAKASVILILIYLAFEMASGHLGNSEMSWMYQSKAMTFAGDLWSYVSSWLFNKGIINHISLPNLIAKVRV